MKKILFFSFPASGHVNSSKELCQELARQDVELKYVTFREHFSKFKDLDNMQLIDYCEEFRTYYFENEERSGKIKSNLIALLNMLYTMTDILCPFVYETVKKEKPDLIICDPFIIAAKMAAKSMNIKYSLFFSLLVQNPVGNKMPPGVLKTILLHPLFLVKTMGLQKKINKKFGEYCDMPGDLLSHQDVPTVVTTSKEFHPYGDYYPETMLFAGPINRKVELHEKDSKLIFVSMGTVESNVKVIETLIEVVRDTNYKLVVTLANNKQNRIDKKDLPNNVTIYDNLTPDEYRKMIDKSSLLVNSGGINSVSDAILSLTPLLICPSSQESHDMGVLVQNYQCGRVFTHKKINVENMKSEVNLIMNDKSISCGLGKYRKSFLNAMGFKKAAEIVVNSIDK